MANSAQAESGNMLSKDSHSFLFAYMLYLKHFAGYVFTHAVGKDENWKAGRQQVW